MIQTINTCLIKSRRSLFGALLILLISFLGCKSWFQKDKNELGDMNLASKTSIAQKYIGDITGHWGMNFAPLNAVALVTQLDGTGSDPKPSGQRDQMLADMKSRQVKNPKEILAGMDTSLAALEAYLPPGAKAGDTFDLKIMQIYNSETTSFRGGYVMETHLRPMAQLNQSVRQGRVAAQGQGRIIVQTTLSDDQSPQNLLKGVIVGGGVVAKDRPLGLAVIDESKSIEATKSIGRALNTRFTVIKNGQRTGVATPKNDRSIELEVADEYRYNVGHFMRVVLNVMVNETEAQRMERIGKLTQELNDPALANQAAVRLEAIGQQAIPRLQNALAHQNSDVQFFAAQSLAYLGKPDGVQILERTAATNQSLRWSALQALVAIKDRSATNALVRLLDAESAEARVGAFRALQDQSPDEPHIQGVKLAHEFYLHQIPSRGRPMVHVSVEKRPDICVFGNEIRFSDNFLFVENGVTIKAIGQGRIQITRYTTTGRETKETSTRVADVIAQLGIQGFDFSKIIELLKNAANSNSINAPLVINAMPRPNRAFEASSDDDAQWAGVRQSGSDEASYSNLVPTANGSGAFVEAKEKKSFWSRFTGLWSSGSKE